MIFRGLAVSGLALAVASPAVSQTYDLGTITVDAETGGFVGDGVELSTGTFLKTGAEIAETPRSVDVVTAQQIYEQGADSVEEALRYTPGVSTAAYGLDDRSDWYTTRGFNPTTFHDGLLARYGYYNDVKPEPFLLDRVEVLRGPASGLYGNGEVGGVVNTESKTAANFSGENLVRIGFSDPRSTELEADFGGVLNEAGTLSYRIVGMVRDGTTQVDKSRDDAYAIAPSITWSPNADTEVTLLYTRQEKKGSPLIQFASIYGTLYPSPDGRYLPDSLFVGEPGFDRYDATRDSLTLSADHRISDIWSVSGRARWLKAESDYDHAWWAFDNYPTRYNSDGTVNRTFYASEKSLRTLSFDAYATADWDLGGWEMQTVIGASYAEGDYDDDAGYATTTTAIDPFDPVYTGAPAVDIVDTPGSYLEEWGVYVQHRATFAERLHVDGGLRFAGIETGEASGTFTDSTVNAEDEAWTGNLAVLYELPNGIAPYVSYAESFRQEIVDADVDGDTFEPTRGEQYEIGVKYQPEGTDDLYTLAVYDITKSNLTEADPANPGFQIQTGEATSRGVEASLRKHLGDFRIDASAMVQDTENVDGYTIATVPEKLASVWATWAPSEGAYDGLSAGLGVRYTGEKWDGTDTVRTPSTTLVDARLAYQWDRYEAALNVTNLADDRTVSFCGVSECYFGEGREVSVSLAARF